MLHIHLIDILLLVQIRIEVSDEKNTKHNCKLSETFLANLWNSFYLC